MAALAGYDRARLRLATTGECVEPGARRLLLDAAEACG
jgi:hypothetical protein